MMISCWGINDSAYAGPSGIFHIPGLDYVVYAGPPPLNLKRQCHEIMRRNEVMLGHIGKIDQVGSHSQMWNEFWVHCCYVHVCFVQVIMCGAPDALTGLGARTFLLLCHRLRSQNNY